MKTAPRTAPRFSLVEEEDDDLPHGVPPHRPQNTFNIDLEYTADDDALLDWEQYSNQRRFRCCGRDWPLPTPPDWWYRYTKRQRRWILTALGCAVTFTALLLLLAAAAATKGHLGRFGAAAAAGQACHWEQWRLPTVVAPHRYNLTLQVQMAPPWQVRGSVGIGVNVTRPTTCVVLHAVRMEVTDVRLGGPQGLQGRFRFDGDREQLTLLWDEVIPVGPAALFLTFQYRLSEGMSGLYRSTYTLQDGQRYSLAVTQMEANSARAAFPCFDEPALKAEFSVEVITMKGLKVLSNMPARVAHHHDHQAADLVTTHFETTPPISTYLVAVVIGNLSSVERSVPATLSGNGSVAAPAPPARRVSVWGTPDRVSNLQYAADAAAAILPAYEAAFGVPYSLPKLDLVAIPDFSAGAMENWGLITYRETALLVSPTSSVLNLRHVVKVVAHEMAHQWFGNLVTMEWWGELWLNEGFASYLEFLGANAAHPEFAFFDSLYTDDVPYAEHFDSKEASHPLSTMTGINSTASIEGLFDPVEYERGGAVLRMLRAWVNRNNQTSPASAAVGRWEVRQDATPLSDPFLAGLRRYLLQYQYSATTAAQLWTALSASLALDVSPLMQEWTYAQGYPVVTVTLDGKRGLWLQQAPFSLGGTQPCDSTKAWWVPVPYTTSEAPGQVKWGELNACQSLRPLLTQLPKGSWVKVNAQQYGYFRVNYSAELWGALAAAAAAVDANGFPVLAGVDLAGAIEDSYALAEAGDLNITVFLNNVKTLQQRPASDYAPWAAALPYLYKIALLAPCSGEWRSYLASTLLPGFMRRAAQAAVPAAGAAPAAAPVVFSFVGNATGGSPGEATIGFRLLRPAILKAAGYFGDEGRVAEASAALAALQGGGGPAAAAAVDPDLRSAVYQTAARSAANPRPAFEQIKALYLAAGDADEKDRTLRALGYSPLAAPAALDFALTDAVRAQDVRTVVVTAAAAGDAAAANATWSWVRAHWGALYAKLGGDAEAARRMAQLMEGVASPSADLSMLAEVDALFAAHQEELGDAQAYRARAKESIAANAAWVERNGADLCTWVAAQAASPTP